MNMSNWKKYILGEITILITKGTTPTTLGSKFVKKGINFIKSEAIGYDGRIDKSTFEFIDEETHDKLKRSQLQKDDILFSMAGIFLGKNAIVTKELLPANTNQALAIIRLDNTIASQKFIHYYLRQKNIINYVNNISGQSAQPNINMQEIGGIHINLPPLPTQHRIAEILGALDDKIELNIQMNKTMEEMAMALYKHWFVDFGPFKDGEFVESELGRIPEGWKILTVGAICNIQGGFAFKSKDFIKEGNNRVLKIKNINNNVVSNGDDVFIPENIVVGLDQKFRVLPGSYLIAMTGAEVGKIGLVPKMNEKLWLNQRVGMFVQNGKLANGHILAANILSLPEFYIEIQNLAYGSAQPNISTSGIESIKLPLPIDLTVLAELIQTIKNLHKQKLSNLSENLVLTQTRDYLLPKLISGEIEVKVAKEKIKKSFKT